MATTRSRKRRDDAAEHFANPHPALRSALQSSTTTTSASASSSAAPEVIVIDSTSPEPSSLHRYAANYNPPLHSRTQQQQQQSQSQTNSTSLYSQERAPAPPPSQQHQQYIPSNSASFSYQQQQQSQAPLSSPAQAYPSSLQSGAREQNTSYGSLSGNYSAEMAPNIRNYNHLPHSQYLPSYGAPPPISSYYSSLMPYELNGSGTLQSQYYISQQPNSSPIEPARSYPATPADSSSGGPIAAALRLPPAAAPLSYYAAPLSQPAPPQRLAPHHQQQQQQQHLHHQQQQPQAYLLPPQPNYMPVIDLTCTSPPSAPIGKRRKRDTYYDHQFLQRTVHQPYVQLPPFPMTTTAAAGMAKQPPYGAVSGKIPRPLSLASSGAEPAPWLPLPDLSADVPPNAPPCADKEGFFIVTDDCEITARYKVLRLLGQGTFGKVLEVLDREQNRKVAIKVVRALQKYTDASHVEIKVLRCLEEHDPYQESHCIPLLSTFVYRNHTCMVFPLLSQSVFDYLKENQFMAFLPHQTAEIALQLTQAVVFMHGLKLIHTDLKPENVMIVDTASELVPGVRRTSKMRRRLLNTRVRLIDFGSSIFEKDYHSSIVSTRHYRAPEILLGAGWSYPCDIWSLGCILVELVTGDALFQTHENIEHLAMMENVLGPVPTHLTRTPTAEKYFTKGKLLYPRAETTKQSKKNVAKTKPLRDIIAPKDKYAERLLDLVSRMLKYDPTERISARDALAHPYFSEPLPVPRSVAAAAATSSGSSGGGGTAAGTAVTATRRTARNRG
ncbi:dual specificity protein kinase kns1 [Geranomyces variabilis]|uniref:Dual specificity protein kinase kns1 n=1 Tax=Geranomyces variabilis TaxID=109894 RepID=A0AAD5TKQ5_9FUNG|nr:dual specificity protein kinase kns1 [Geranomyces variabilis]